MTNFGFSNGWKHTPVKIMICKYRDHKIITEKISRCETKITCKICDYEYRIDSGD